MTQLWSDITIHPVQDDIISKELGCPVVINFASNVEEDL